MSTDATTPDVAAVPPAESAASDGHAAVPEPPRGWAGFLYVSGLQLLYVFVLYVLSTGPMYWWIYEAYVFGSSPFLQRLYLPLVRLAEAWPWFSDFLDWWIGLWVL